MSADQLGDASELVLDDFEYLKTVGTGTFGRVRLVKHKVTGRFYAMKILDKKSVVQHRQVQHILNEKFILSSIQHPFIVNLAATFQTTRKLLMVLEYVPGGELFSHLRMREKFPLDIVRRYAAEIVLAFEYLHARNIVYRDLKPENLLLDEKGHIKITDFGFGKIINERTFTMCGTPEYLAPEIIQSRGHGKAVDWWALGILIYEMTAGYPPFYDADGDPYKTYEQILSQPVQFTSDFDSDTRSLVRHLLQKNKSQRLGNLHGGAQDVKQHRFFDGVNWDAIFQRRTDGPIIPKVKGADDTSNFEDYSEDDDLLDPAKQRRPLKFKGGVDPFVGF
ncbi:Protein kinase domain [Carpediemonas membranifera]|uniref:Protein kinase domain n=1 Tax=Carpediemonas membranifera TaxID=201153 RepID=A0A8J6E6J1_9EUKA|nr:cAMP-dependent protein kinase [Carpediemonas membranifera]KAG9397179.1 Protein kinase domain [Carpediemonas membranifera]|eukprot:KAG9397177.1 cAMP-dependent protein kinase [Carpediemonas membranifera]